jgi:16S rRNA (guanine1207-N2)-methyltransferase
MVTERRVQNLYGILPPEFLDVGAEPRQYSPLHPEAQALEQCPEGRMSNMSMLAPFGTIERRYALALALRALAPRGGLTVMAPKDKGGARLKQELRHFGCDVVEEARRHFRICTCLRSDILVGLAEAMADGEPRLLDALALWTQPGVFSWTRLDPGSTLLLSKLPAMVGRGADFGCGIGYLSASILASPDVQHLTLIDIDRRAIDCARRNINDPRASFLWGDVAFCQLDNLDFVVMNPPFHDAGIENQSLGQTFIVRAHAALRIKGVCWLTANRHLPYEGALTSLFKSVTLKADIDGFKIYEAVK